MSVEFEQIRRELDLVPHFEGGYFCEVYRTACSSNERAAGSHIYYALQNEDRSKFHRTDADDMWHFYLGSPVVIIELDANEKGNVKKTVLGSDISIGQKPFYVIKKGTWFGAHLLREKTWALCGVTVAPAFVPEGFMFGKREELLKEYPEARELILNMTSADE
ncbi:uncharacterized protein [Oscarella lobularis]|uniref:uncharacterized protein n=1 Tax=Oscarella lobularis TaxID=121494 RepID=UPI0033144B9B